MQPEVSVPWSGTSQLRGMGTVARQGSRDSARSQARGEQQEQGVPGIRSREPGSRSRLQRASAWPDIRPGTGSTTEKHQISSR